MRTAFSREAGDSFEEILPSRARGAKCQCLPRTVRKSKHGRGDAQNLQSTFVTSSYTLVAPPMKSMLKDYDGTVRRGAAAKGDTASRERDSGGVK